MKFVEPPNHPHSRHDSNSLWLGLQMRDGTVHYGIFPNDLMEMSRQLSKGRVELGIISGNQNYWFNRTIRPKFGKRRLTVRIDRDDLAELTILEVVGVDRGSL